MESHGPVIADREVTVQAHVRMPQQRVIVWIEHSYAGLQALRQAVTEACRSDTVLFAVHVTRTRLGPAGPGMPHLPATPDPARAHHDVRLAFDQAMGGLPEGMDIRVAAVAGAPGQRLIELADRPNDLLILGDHSGEPRAGRSWLCRTVGTYCRRRAYCRVLLAQPPLLVHALSRLSGRPRRWIRCRPN